MVSEQFFECPVIKQNMVYVACSCWKTVHDGLENTVGPGQVKNSWQLVYNNPYEALVTHSVSQHLKIQISHLLRISHIQGLKL